ncbi:MAG: hypothetical protein D6711_15615 [Chloroflexi bacterium]|nr:MAG: hypothetical protein D6711_15615 [Chloroflexota bacterium]
MKETKLYNGYGEQEATSVKLKDVKGFIEENFPGWNPSIHFEDNDDYGVKHYILIQGVGDTQLTINKDYGGMFCPTDRLECVLKDSDSKNRVTMTIGENYAENLIILMQFAEPYLKDEEPLENLEYDEFYLVRRDIFFRPLLQEINAEVGSPDFRIEYIDKIDAGHLLGTVGNIDYVSNSEKIKKHEDLIIALAGVEAEKGEFPFVLQQRAREIATLLNIEFEKPNLIGEGISIYD